MFDVGIIIGAFIGGRNNFVGDVPEMAGFVLMLDFDVGEGGLMVGAEIDELLAAIDHAIIPHLLESLIDTRDDVLIKSESEIIPSTRGTKSAELEFHIAALLFDKVPNASVEFIAGIFKAGVAFLLKGAFVDDPSLEAGVVGTGDIPSAFTTKTIIASEGIFEGDGETVTDVKIAVGVGGGMTRE